MQRKRFNPHPPAKSSTSHFVNSLNISANAEPITSLQHIYLNLFFVKQTQGNQLVLICDQDFTEVLRLMLEDNTKKDSVSSDETNKNEENKQNING